MKRLAFIALVIITMVSCKSSSFFEEVDFNEGDKLVFEYLNDDYIIPDNDHEFHKKHGHFYISDINTLNYFKELVKEKTRRPFENSGSAYMIKVIGKDKNYFLGMYDLKKEVMFSDSYYKVRVEDVEKLSDKFIAIEKYKISFKTFPSLKKGIELLKENNFDVLNYEQIKESGIAEYVGITRVRTTRKEFSNRQSIESIMHKIKSDFAKVDFKFDLLNIYANTDSIQFEIASNNCIKESIPEKYEIIKPFGETIDFLGIKAYNIDNVDLKALFEKNNIKYELL